MLPRRDTSPSPIDEPARLRDFAPAILLLLLTVVGIGIVAAVPSKDAREVAVLLRPGAGLLDAAALVSLAGGTMVDGTGLPNLVVAIADRPGFVPALYQAGAWLVLDPIVARGCGAIASPSQGKIR